MQVIDVRDLPEPVAQAIQSMVQTLRQQMDRGKIGRQEQGTVQLPRWPGTVIGTVRRAEIYDDERSKKGFLR